MPGVRAVADVPGVGATTGDTEGLPAEEVGGGNTCTLTFL